MEVVIALNYSIIVPVKESVNVSDKSSVAMLDTKLGALEFRWNFASLKFDLERHKNDDLEADNWNLTLFNVITIAISATVLYLKW